MTSFEKTEMDNVLEKLAMSRIHLAKVYCNLILGRGMAQQYSGKCVVPSPRELRGCWDVCVIFCFNGCYHNGQSFGFVEKPSLQKDRSYSEGLYNFSSYVTWLVFRRKHFQAIREEIGRLLCSDVFNPALRGQKNIELQKPGDGTSDANTVQLPYPRKDHDKHPSISTMIQQCSPVLSTLLPLPKDSAQYLFQNHDCQARDPQPRTCDDLMDFSELFTNKVGIIGAHCSELKSLLSMSDETKEEEEAEQEETQGRKSSDLSLAPLRSPQNRLSTQSTVL